jgi:hypothetical protein
LKPTFATIEEMARRRESPRSSGGQANQRGETSRTLDSAMMEPSTAPDVVVLDFLDEERTKEVADPKKDLWLSTADGCVFFSSLRFCFAPELPSDIRYHQVDTQQINISGFLGFNCF